ncbi:MAG: glycosyltransferase [Candidatus Falkowbacteria bacterium]
MELPLVSIIITTKNEEKNIENCLASIKSQTYPVDRIEVIVVDNSSSDKTKEIALKYTDKVFNKGPERSAQRNFGVEKSAGEYFLYLDADMILQPGIIDECVSLTQKDVGIVGLYVPEIVTGAKFWSEVRRFERSFYHSTVIDCVRFIKRKTFIEVGGFDETMTGPEDWDLDKKLRLRGQVALIKTHLFHNEAEFDLKKYLSKKAYYIKSLDRYSDKWGKNDADVKKQLGVCYRLITVFTEDGKWIKLIMHPVLTSGMYLLRVLVGIKYCWALLQKILSNHEEIPKKQKNIDEERECRKTEIVSVGKAELAGFDESADYLYKFLMANNILNSQEHSGQCLELGCGFGAFTFKLAKLGYNICGTDVSEEQIEFNNKRCVENNLSPMFKVLNITTLDKMAGESVDYIFLTQLLHHLVKIEDIFAELFRILKRNGKIIIIEANTSNFLRFITAALIKIDIDIFKRRLRLAAHSNEGFHLIRTYKKCIKQHGNFSFYPYCTSNNYSIPKYRIFSRLLSFFHLSPKYYATDICLVGAKEKPAPCVQK